jgi:hypothetical protein
MSVSEIIEIYGKHAILDKLVIYVNTTVNCLINMSGQKQ